MYYLIDDLLHPKNLVFRADVKAQNSPIYQNFFVIFVYLYLYSGLSFIDILMHPVFWQPS